MASVLSDNLIFTSWGLIINTHDQTPLAPLGVMSFCERTRDYPLRNVLANTPQSYFRFEESRKWQVHIYRIGTSQRLPGRARRARRLRCLFHCWPPCWSTGPASLFFLAPFFFEKHLLARSRELALLLCHPHWYFKKRERNQ